MKVEKASPASDPSKCAETLYFRYLKYARFCLPFYLRPGSDGSHSGATPKYIFTLECFPYSRCTLDISDFHHVRINHSERFVDRENH